MVRCDRTYFEEYKNKILKNERKIFRVSLSNKVLFFDTSFALAKALQYGILHNRK